MNDIPSGAVLTAFHDDCLRLASWPRADAGDLLKGVASAWIAKNHFCNSSLWEEEDLARRKKAPDHEIVANKRAIDSFNQARNDAIERIDEAILDALAEQRGAFDASARLNSETAGSMIDRLSILSLKIRSMREQTERDDRDDAFRINMAQRLRQLQEQRDDLAHCFDALIADCIAGRARYKIYRQHKMYNDPSLNPALLAENASGA
ncbi:MAG: DUF4254 domain-containing protein [Pseudomonadota bacterium]